MASKKKQIREQIAREIEANPPLGRDFFKGERYKTLFALWSEPHKIIMNNAFADVGNGDKQRELTLGDLQPAYRYIFNEAVAPTHAKAVKICRLLEEFRNAGGAFEYLESEQVKDYIQKLDKDFLRCQRKIKDVDREIGVFRPETKRQRPGSPLGHLLLPPAPEAQCMELDRWLKKEVYPSIREGRSSLKLALKNQP